MIGLGLASSHAPVIFCPAEAWRGAYDTIPEYTKQSQPHTAKLETLDVIRSYIERIDRAFAVLRVQLEQYKADALIVIGDDQGDMFNSSNNPTFCVFTGSEVRGSMVPRYVKEPPEKSRISIPVQSRLAQFLLRGLIKRGFDLAASDALASQGSRPERGVSHMLVYPYPRLAPGLDVPVIPVFVNEYYPPLPSAKRCWDLGVAIADIFRDRPERIAIYASGGMSHELNNLFTFDSDTLRGGTGELRAWIAAAGACQWPGKVVEYIPCHHAKTGLGFCYWPVRDGTTTSRPARADRRGQRSDDFGTAA